MNRPIETAYYHKPRDSWKVIRIYAMTAGAARVPTIADTEVDVEIDVTTPLWRSPFIFGSSYGKRGF